ncbi:hypothetical protein SAMN05216532_5315 [Streptomyces sp. 2231.1]|nr:hypothetical protein SAMN05216532_5315 [Streptomyces sp. 2231.1]
MQAISNLRLCNAVIPPGRMLDLVNETGLAVGVNLCPHRGHRNYGHFKLLVILQSHLGPPNMEIQLRP